MTYPMATIPNMDSGIKALTPTSFASVETSPRGRFESMRAFCDVYRNAMRRVYNLEWLLWGIVSFFGLYLLLDQRHSLHQIVALTWITGYLFCALVCCVVVAKQEFKIVRETHSGLQQSLLENDSTPN